MRARVEILRAARARIADPAHWTAGHFARDRLGRVVSVNSPEAVCWCAFGALRAEEPELHGEERAALNASARELFDRGFIGVNDELGHAAVLEFYDHSIAKVEAGR